MNKLQNLFAFQRGTWKVNPNALHYRIYQWWLANTDSTKTSSWGYRENFCHYWRVVLLWSPLLWFFVVPIFQYGRLSWRLGWIRPWMVVTGLMVVAALAYAILFSPQLLSVLVTFGLSALVVLAFIACVIGINLLSKSRSLDRFFGWFFLSHKWVVVYPWSVTLVALVALGCLTLGVKATGEVILTILVVVGALIVFFLAALVVTGAGYGVVWLVKKGWGFLVPSARRAPVRPTYSRSTAHSSEKGMSTVGLAARAVWAQHNRICPLVELPDQDTDFSW